MTQIREDRPPAVVYPTIAGLGGWGMQAATCLTALSIPGSQIHAFGPGFSASWPLESGRPPVVWHQSPPFSANRLMLYIGGRFWPGDLVYRQYVAMGSWAADRIRAERFGAFYVFTQVGLETLRYARQNGIPSVLDNANGHIRDFLEAYAGESLRWCGRRFRGHPTSAMVDRIEEEYRLADRIRVSSTWAKESMVRYGVPADKISVFDQPVNLTRFRPASTAPVPDGPLRLCYVGTLDLRKGFVHLLRAMRMAGPDRFRLQVIGSTGDPCSRRLFEAERRGLAVAAEFGDPVPAYQNAELFVLPSLEDGFGFVVAEAMACGLPVVVTDRCGSAEWVRTGHAGWVVPPADAGALAAALEDAVRNRSRLRAIGLSGRAEVERRAGSRCLADLRDWFFKELPARSER